MPDSTPATIDHSYILPFPRWSSARGEKKRISIFPWHSTSTSGGYTLSSPLLCKRTPPLFLPGRMRWEIKVTSLAQTRLFSSLFFFSLRQWQVIGFGNEFRRYPRFLSRKKCLVNLTISRILRNYQLKSLRLEQCVDWVLFFLGTSSTIAKFFCQWKRQVGNSI